MRRRLLPLLILAALLAGMPAPAAAQTLGGEVRFEGGLALTVGGEAQPPIATTVVADCSTDPCTVTASVVNNDFAAPMTADQSYPVADGRIDAVVPDWADLCSLDQFFPAGPLAMVFTADAVAVTRSGSGTGEVACDDGSTAQAFDFLMTGTLPRVSGEAPCTLTGTCPVEPTAQPTAPGAAPVAAPASGRPRPADDPGVLSGLPTVADVATPRDLVFAVAGSIVLVLLIALPTALLDSVAERVSAAAATLWRRLRRQTDAAHPALTLRGWLPALGGLAVAGILSAFVDPRLGPDLAGLRTVASVLLSLGIAVALGWLVVLLATRRTHPAARRALEFRPLTLVLVLAAVLFSRLTGFEPGLVFGLVAGVVLGGALATADRARFALLGLGWAFAVGAVCWIAYSLVPETSDALVFVRETLASVTVAGFAALPIALLPVRGLVGRDVWEWSKPAWGAVYGLGMAAFLLAVLRAPFAWDSVSASVWAWGGLFGGYALGAVALWLGVTRPWAKAPADA